MHHSFDVDLAKEYGVNHAIVIASFQFWIGYNKARGKNLRNGKYWTYNSVKNLGGYFPYFTQKQLRRIIDDLVAACVLQKGEFNKASFDRTCWYSFINEDRFIGVIAAGIPSLPNGQMDNNIEDETFAQTVNSFAQTGNPIPVSKPTVSNNQFKTKKPEENSGSSSEEMDTMISGAEIESPPVAAAPPTNGHAPDQKLFDIPVQSKNSGKPKTLLQKLTQIYFDWHNKEVGVAPMFDKAQGQAMKGIEDYLIKVLCKKAEEANEERVEKISHEEIQEAIVEFWQMIFDRWHDLETFYQQQTKVTQIKSNLTNIIKQLKDATKDRFSKSGAGKANSIRDEVAKRHQQRQ